MSGAEQFNPFNLADGTIDEIATDNIFNVSLSDNSDSKALRKALKALSSSSANFPLNNTNVDFSLNSNDETNLLYTNTKRNQNTFDNWLLVDNNIPTIPLITPQSTTNSDPITGNAPKAKTLALLTPTTPNFAIKTEGTFTVNGSSSFDINSSDIQDDALIHASRGFTINGNPTLPVIRDTQGNPITDNNGKLTLVNNAVTVAPGYNISNASTNRYANLIPPQIIDSQSVILPNYSDIKQQELLRRTPPNATTITFNAQNNPINNANQWTSKFPPTGTPTNPTIVKVINGSLNIPSNVNLNNYIITVESGDINFNGNNQNLNNTVLITNNGNINLSNIQAKDLSVFASGTINTNGGARFSGNTLFANNSNIIFNGATSTTNPTDNLTIISAGNITYNGASNTRGSFLTAKDFTYNGSSTLYGEIKAKGNIIFNGNSKISAAFKDPTSPLINANLSLDTGTSNSDKITFDPTITGKLTDNSLITTFQLAFNNNNYLNILNQLNPDGSFTLSRSSLEQILGTNITDGVHTLHFVARDLYGNISNPFDFTFTLDTTAPTAPTPTLLPQSDSGISNADRLTKITTPTIAGNSEPGTIVKLFNNNQQIGSATTAANGTWQLVTTPLTQGNHSLTATATDIAGNTSTKGTPLDIIVDSVVPTLTLTTPIDTIPLSVGSKLTGIVDGTGSNITSLEYFFDNNAPTSIPINADLSFDSVIDFTEISNGSHALTIITTDAAGNVTSNRYNVTVIIDTTAPEITANLVNDTGNYDTDRITNDPTITGTVTDASTVVELLAGFNSNLVSVKALLQPDGSFALNRTQLEEIYGSTLPEGNHTLHLQATNFFGNISKVLDIPFTLDSTPPIILFDLDVASDTLPVGDRQTTNNIVTLTGQTQPDAKVTLLETNTTVEADATGKFSLKGVSLNLGANTFTVQATDIAGNTSTISRTIEREQVPLNQAPVITSTPDTEVYYYKPYTYKVTATDPENDPLTYSLVSPATGPMAGMSINSQGLLSWTPFASGNYNVTVRVSDNFGNQTDQTYTLKVTGYADNRPPVFTSVPVISATYQNPYTYQAIALDPDYYSDLTYSLVNGPANMSIQSNGLVSWKPEGNQADIHPVTIKATDYYGATAIQSFNIAVGGMAQGNNSPLIVSNQETQAYTTQPYTYQVKALDPDNDTLNYSLTKAPLGMTIKADTGLVSWQQPIFSSVPDDITVQVQDGKGGIDTQSFQLTVSSATPGGQIAGTVWEDLNGNQSQDAGERGLASVQLYLDANHNAQPDVGEKTLTTDTTGSYQFTGLAAGYYVVRQVVPEGFEQTSPSGAAYGESLVKNGSFEEGPANTGNGSISIYANSTPFAVTDWTVKGNSIDYIYNNFWQSSDGNVSIDLNGYGQGAITQVISTTPGQTYQVSFDNSYNPDASYERVMSVRADGQSALYTLLYDGHTYNNMNYKPQQWTFTATSSTTELGFYSETGGTYGAVIDNVVVRPYEVGGLYHAFTLTEGNRVQNKNFGNKKLSTVPANRQPSFTSTAPNSATVGQTWRYQTLATDPDSDTLTYELTSFPEGMTIDTATGLIAWKPTEAQLIGSGGPTLSSGVYDVGVRVSDGKGGLNSQFFLLQVTSPDSNSPPVFITSSPKTAATVGQPYQFTLLALDPEGDVVTYSSPNTFAFGASLNPNTGEITWTPTGVGQANFIINATDTKGASTVKTFTIEGYQPKPGQLVAS